MYTSCPDMYIFADFFNVITVIDMFSCLIFTTTQNVFPCHSTNSNINNLTCFIWVNNIFCEFNSPFGDVKSLENSHIFAHVIDTPSVLLCVRFFTRKGIVGDISNNPKQNELENRPSFDLLKFETIY